MIIGITCYHRKNEKLTEKQQKSLRNYQLALQDAGADSKVIYLPDDGTSRAEIQRLAKAESHHLDGLILSGGANMPPQIYGATPGPYVEKTCPTLRPFVDWAFVEEVLSQDKPVLGICFGVQMLNVIHGGTLIQDIPALIPNAIQHREVTHEIRTEPGSFLREWIGESSEVASYHHQCIQHLAPSARVAARASDGIIEAIEFPERRFCIGTQWHPEKTRENASTKAIFQEFTKACAS